MNNTNIISEFLNVDASDISVVQGTDDTKGTFRVTHDGKGDEENYFSQPKFVNINDDGVVSFLTEDEVRREDPKFYDTHNKVEELKYWEKAEDMSYFDDFNNWDDKYDEDRVVAHLNYKLKKYGITARVAPYRFAEDYIILSDGKGNTQEINLGAFEGADFWSPGSPGFLGGGPEKQLSHLYYNRRPSFSTTSRSGKLEDAYLITNFVKEHGRQYDSLVWSETQNKRDEEKIMLLPGEEGHTFTDELDKFNIYQNRTKHKESKKVLLEEYNLLETEEEKNKFLIDNNYSTDKINIKDYAARNNIKLPSYGSLDYDQLFLDKDGIEREEITQLELEAMERLNFGMSDEHYEFIEELDNETVRLYNDVDQAMEQLKVGTDKMNNLIGVFNIYDVKDYDDERIKNEKVKEWLHAYFLDPNNRETLTRIAAGGGWDENIKEKEGIIQEAKNAVFENELARFEVEKNKFEKVRNEIEIEQINLDNEIESYNTTQTKILDELNPLKLI